MEGLNIVYRQENVLKQLIFQCNLKNDLGKAQIENFIIKKYTYYQISSILSEYIYISSETIIWNKCTIIKVINLSVL